MKKIVSMFITVTILFLLLTFNTYALVINEFVANHTGTDTHEFIEVFGNPSTNYSDHWILEIEGDGSSAGIIDGAWNVGPTSSDGFWTTGFLNGQIENGTMTLLLVTDFSGSLGDDIDGNDDGSIDNILFNHLLDSVGVYSGGINYWHTGGILTSGFDGIIYTPGGASRIPNGLDTNSVSDWVRNDFDGDGLPGFTNAADPTLAVNTPGTFNRTAVPVPAAVYLLGAGFLGLAGIRRKLKKVISLALYVY